MVATLERASDFVYVGKEVIRIDALDKVSGAEIHSGPVLKGYATC